MYNTKKRIMKKLLLIALLTSTSLSVNAMTLEEGLAYSYQNKENFKIIQQDFYKKIEPFAQAIAGSAPTIRSTVSATSKSTTNTNDTARDEVRDPFGAEINVRQNLFNFGSGSLAIKAGQHTAQAAIYTYYLEEQREIFEAINTYVTFIETKQGYEAFQKRRQSAEVILESEQAKFRLGQVSLVDVSRAEANLAVAQVKEAEATEKHETAKGAFAIFFGEFDPEQITWPFAEDNLLEGGFDKFKERVMSQNYEILSAKYGLLASKASYKSSVAKLLPSVDLTADVTTSYGISENAKKNADQRGTNYSVGVGVTMPLLNLQQNVAARSAKSDTRKAAYGYDQALKTLEKKVTSLWETYKLSKVRIDAAQKALEASQIAFDGVSNQYRLGEKGLTDVLKAESELLDAETQNIQAKKSHILNVYIIKNTVGELTARALNLNVKYFRPEMELKKAKANVFGF